MCVIPQGSLHVEDGVTHPQSWVGREQKFKIICANLSLENGEDSLAALDNFS